MTLQHCDSSQLPELKITRKGIPTHRNMAAEAGEDEVLEFKWGKQRGVGGRKKGVRFYESFTFDGVYYALFDSVFLFKEGESVPYIGKLVKIWETPDKSKKVKILWYFRPSEIRNFLEGTVTQYNELFLASGEGPGLTNVCPLESIAGKCNVVCISNDSRNPYPSDKELQMAEFVFYRFFDVGKRMIVDKIDDMIAGVEVKNIFNNLDSQKPVGLVKHDLERKEVSGNVTTSNEVVALMSQKTSQPLIVKPDSKSCDSLVRENAVSQLMLGKTHIPSVGVKENGVSKASLVKAKSSTKLSYGSGAGLEMRNMAKTDVECGNGSIEKNNLRDRADSKKDDLNDVGVLDGQNSKGIVGEKVLEKDKRGGFSKVSSAKVNSNTQNRRLITYDDDDDDNNLKSVAPSSKDKYKHPRAKDSCVEEGPSKKLKIDKKPTNNLFELCKKDSCVEEGPSEKLKIVKKPTNLSKSWKEDSRVEEGPSKKFKIDKKPTNLTKSCKESSSVPSNMEHKLDFHAKEVTRKPDVDKSKWFKAVPWEEKMKNAYELGKLVLLENLDPSLSSSEVQDIIMDGFKESCTAKMIQKTAYSSPHSGQAFVIFRRKETAELVIRKLEEGCFLMSNGRPLVGSIGVPCFPEKKPIFHGHHVVDQLRLMQMQREMKDAVSTSHCSQPNNIEYDMAIEWCVLQERGDKLWKMLYQQQGEELSRLKVKLKSQI